MFESTERSEHPVVPVLDAVDDALTAGRQVEAWSLSDDALAGALRRCEALAAQQAELGLRLLAEADARDLGRRSGAPSTMAWLRGVLRLRPGEAKARVDLARRLRVPADDEPTDYAATVGATDAAPGAGSMPACAAALADGEISVDHAVVVARTMAQLPSDTPSADLVRADADLSAFAREHDPATLAKLGDHLLHVLSDESLEDREERTVERRDLKLVDRGDGTVRISGLLDSEGAATVRSALDPLAAPRPAADGSRDPRRASQRLAEALIELAALHLSSGDLPADHGVKPHLVLLAGLDTLLGPHAPACAHHSPEHDSPGHGGATFGDDRRGAGEGDQGDPAAGGRSRPTRGTDQSPGPCTSGPRTAGPCGDGSSGPARPRQRSPRWIHDTWARRFGVAPAELLWGGPISAAALRRRACDATITTVLIDDNGVPLRVGRAQRSAIGGLWIALTARDRGCTFPGCTRPPAWCDAHHIRHWADGGPTDLENLALLCGHHHRVVHHGGWDIRLARDGHPEFLPPPWIDPGRAPRRQHLPRHERQPPPAERDTP